MERDNRRLILGSIFIVIGTIFLLDNFDVLDFSIPKYLLRWEMILIVIGIFNILNKNYSLAFVLIAIGAFFWIMDETNVNFWDLWPVVLIIIGVSFILRKGVFAPVGEKEVPGSPNTINEFVIMGGSERKPGSIEFTGGKITTIMGGCDVDLRDSQLQPGVSELDIICFMGGVDLKIPPNWQVILELSPILGGVDDKRRMDELTDPDRTLVIRGYCMFGGVEIKN